MSSNGVTLSQGVLSRAEESARPDSAALNGRRRTRAGSIIPSDDPHLPGNYGRCNSTENHYHQLKLMLPNKRLNVCRINRVRRRMVAHFFAKNLEAVLAWHERTGGDISHLSVQPPPLADAA